MKKRKELDALVSNGKLGKRIKKGSGSCSAHELLRHDTDSSDMEDFSILQPRRNGRKKGGSRLHLSTVCLPFCQFVLVSTCVLVSGTLIWLHIGLREDLDILRAHLQKVEAGNRNTPEALHSIHSKLKQLDSNVTTLYLDIRKNIVNIDNASSEIKLLKETTSSLQASIAAAPAIQQLPKDVHSLSESVASFGSKITALETTVKELKDQQSVFQSTTQTLSGELDSVKTVVQELSNVTKSNTTDIQSKPPTLFGNLPIQSAIQETNQLAAYVQKELMDLITSVDKMNSTLFNQITAFKDLSTKVETINNALVLIINDTHGQSARIFTLENYTYTNLTLRVDHLESEKQTDIGRYHSSSETPSDMQEYVNRSISKALVDILNSEFILNDQLDGADNFSIKVLTQAHNYLMLMAGLLKQLSPIQVSEILNAKNATEQVTMLLNSTFHELIKEQDSKIQVLEENLTNLTIHVLHHDDQQVTPLFEVASGTHTMLLSDNTNSTESLTSTEKATAKDELSKLVTDDKS